MGCVHQWLVTTASIGLQVSQAQDAAYPLKLLANAQLSILKVYVAPP